MYECSSIAMRAALNAASAWLPAAACVAAIICAGGAIMPSRWRKFPAPWPWALAAMLGWHLAAGLVFFLGCFGMLTRAGLAAGFWLPLAVLSGVFLLREYRKENRPALLPNFKFQISNSKSALPELILLAVMLLFVCVLAIIATAPPTKHDELQYHLLPAQRGLIDGSFRFYSTPYNQIPPHVAHQSLFTVLLAFGNPAACGVFCLLWGLMFVAFAYGYVAQISRTRGLLCAAIILVAFKNCVWWAAPNPESVGSLWCLMLFAYLLDEENLWPRSVSAGVAEDQKDRPHGGRPQQRSATEEKGISLGSVHSAAIAGLLSAAAAMTKLPFVILIFGSVALILWRSRNSLKNMALGVGAGCLLVAVTYGPWLLRTYLWTGNPFGYAAPDVFGSSVFDVDALARTLSSVRAANQRAHLSLLTPVLAPIAWAKDTWIIKDLNFLHPFAAALGIPALVARRRYDTLVFAIASYVVSAYLLPHDIRFHLFPAYGLLAAGVMWTPIHLASERLRRLLPLAASLVCIPCVLGAAYYSKVFLDVVFGGTSADDFLGARVGLYEVYDWCGRHTPKNSRFCIAGPELARPFYLNRIGLVPEGITLAEQPAKTNFALGVLKFMEQNSLDHVISVVPLDLPADFEWIATFENTITESFRTPGKKPERGKAIVYRRIVSTHHEGHE